MATLPPYLSAEHLQFKMGQQSSSDRNSDKSLGRPGSAFSGLRKKILPDKNRETSPRPVTDVVSNSQAPAPPPKTEGTRRFDKVDSCVHAAWQNHRDSPLVRLTDALLVAIMERLDEDDVLRLRHTSRTFMRLFSQSNAFQTLHLTNHEDENRRRYLGRVWAVPRKSILIPSRRNDGKASRCDLCQSTREHGSGSKMVEVVNSLPLLHCSGCLVKHRTPFFSPEQRRESNDDERICIGRERSILLCSHISVTWEMINRLADRSPSNNTIICKHEQHVIGYREIHSSAQPASSACTHDDKPRLKAWRSGNGDLCIEISANIHVMFEPLDPGRDRLRSMAFRFGRVPRTVVRYFGDRASWVLMFRQNHALDFLKPFDPNVCSCLDWGAPTSGHGFVWELSPNPRRPWREAHPPGSDYYTGADEIRRAPDDRCAGYRHGIEKLLGGKTIRRLDWYKCGAGGNQPFPKYMVLNLTLESRICSPVDPEWGRILDIPRWELDEELAGIGRCSEHNHCGWCQRLDVWKRVNKHLPSVDERGERWVMVGTDENRSSNRESNLRRRVCRRGDSDVAPDGPPPYTSSLI